MRLKKMRNKLRKYNYTLLYNLYAILVSVVTMFTLDGYGVFIGMAAIIAAALVDYIFLSKLEERTYSYLNINFQEDYDQTDIIALIGVIKTFRDKVCQLFPALLSISLIGLILSVGDGSLPMVSFLIVFPLCALYFLLLIHSTYKYCLALTHLYKFEYLRPYLVNELNRYMHILPDKNVAEINQLIGK